MAPPIQVASFVQPTDRSWLAAQASSPQREGAVANRRSLWLDRERGHDEKGILVLGLDANPTIMFLAADLIDVVQPNKEPGASVHVLCNVASSSSPRLEDNVHSLLFFLHPK